MLNLDIKEFRLLHFSLHQQVMGTQLDYNVASKWKSESTSYQYKIGYIVNKQYKVDLLEIVQEE